MDLTSILDVNALSHAFSSNMYVSALVMILLNVGTSYLMQDLMPIAHRIFSFVWVRRLVFFAIFFTATRDLKVSLLLMILFTLLVDMFLNENSEYCLIPYEYRLPQPQMTNSQSQRPQPQQQLNVQQQQEHFKHRTSLTRFDRFKQNAERWSLSKRPISYW